MTIDELKTLHWQTLKKMAEDAGIEFKSKEQAIEDLAKLQPAEPAAPDAVADPAIDPAAEQPAEPGEPTFDRNRPHGVICGDVEGMPGARYVQDGKHFNAAGKLLG